MTWQPALVALDVDGTLVDASNIVAPQVRAAIQRVADAGVPVILSTGRAWASALTVIEQLPFEHAEHVCSNGAVTVRYPPFEVVDVLTFDPRPVVDRILAEHPAPLLAVEVVGSGYRVSSEFPAGELHGEIEVVSVDELAGSDVTRVIVRDPNASEETRQATLADESDPLQVGTSIPGMVSRLCVKQGDRVEKDQVLAVIEAMKMETAITARAAGTVKTIRVKEGQPVKAKELLMVLE